MAKTYADSFLYKKSIDYGKEMYKFIVGANRIDTKSSEFEDILFDVKRRKVSDKLAKVITSENVVIGIGDKSLPKAFRVFVAQDIKTDKKYKVFIDATDFIKYGNGAYVCSELNWLISYTIAGITAFVFKLREPKLTMDSSIILDGGYCFIAMLSYTIDRIYKITSVQQIKKRIDYACALYYQVNLLCKDSYSESQFKGIKNYAMRISDIDDTEARIVDIMLKQEDLENIDSFIKALGRMFNLKDIKIDAILSTWLKSFGTGTIFALEYFPAFAMVMTNTYIGGYIDNQITIEKVCSKSLPKFCKTILEIAEEVV